MNSNHREGAISFILLCLRRILNLAWPSALGHVGLAVKHPEYPLAFSVAQMGRITTVSPLSKLADIGTSELI